MKCIFCGEERDIVLHKHHIFPKFIIDRFPTNERERGETVTVCQNCVKGDTIIAGDYLPISEKRPGDNCLGRGGRAEITNCFSREYDGPMVRIKGSGLLPVEFTPEHPILVATSVGGKARIESFTEPYWKLAEDVIPKKSGRNGDYLVIPKMKGWFESTEIDISPFTTERGRKIVRSKGYPLSLPVREDTAWLLGMYVAEGVSCSYGIIFSLGKGEGAIAERIAGISRQLGYKPSIRPGRTALRMIIYSRILARAFPAWFGRRAHRKCVPDFILYHKDEKILRSFLDGYLEGGGTKSDIQRPSTASARLAHQIQMICSRLGLWCSIRRREPRSRCAIEGREVNERPLYMLEIRDPVRSWAKFFDDYILSPVRRVETTYHSGRVYNLETSNSTYLVSNFVVHNCHTILHNLILLPIEQKLKSYLHGPIQQAGKAV